MAECHDHHVVPRSRGGTRTVPLCVDCHAKAHHRDKAMSTPKLTRDALQAKKAKGERVGAVPYGFTLASDGVALVRCPHESAVVELVRSLRADGLTLRAVAAALAARGMLSRNGRPFAATQISRMVAEVAL